MSDRIKMAAKTDETKGKKAIYFARKNELSSSTTSPIDRILYLQRTVGNQAVQRLIKSGLIQTMGDSYEREEKETLQPQVGINQSKSHVSSRRLLAHKTTQVVQQDKIGIIQRARLLDFKDSKPEHDPSKLSDSDIEATNEYKAYMNPNLIWQWQLKVTREEALLGCRLLLRHMRAGNKVIWKIRARKFILTARKQLGTLKEAEKLTGKLEWVGSSESEFKSPETASSDFAKWLLAGGPEPSDTGKMNCWEMILFAAFQGNIVSKKRLKKIYKDAAKKSGMAIPAEIEKTLCKGSKLIFDPSDPNSPEPLPGDIIIFDIIANHAAIALGTKAGGEHEVISHWTPPDFSTKVKKTTIEKLLPEAGVTRVKFCTSAW